MAVCACAMGSWTTGRVNVQQVNTEKIDNFLGMTEKYGDNGFYPTPTVTDTGVVENATMASLAATVVAAINTAAAIEIARKQYNIAKSYYNMAKQRWDWFKTVYLPCETKAVAEACGTPEYSPQYGPTSDAYRYSTVNLYGEVIPEMNRLYGQYCICPDSSMYADASLAAAIALGDSGNFALRYEENRKLAKDDVRWNRRAQELNRGRNLLASAFSYAQAAADAYGNLGNQIGQAAEGAAGALGYFMNRNNTVYPQRTEVSYPGNSSGWSGMENSLLFGNGVSIQGYNNDSTIYDTNSTLDSIIGSQTYSSTGA